MAKTANDVAALSDAEIIQELSKVEIELYELGISLRTNQSNDLKGYHNLKKHRARLKTEQTARRKQQLNSQQ